jgi:crotonobetainyl-CoA:carnitine CoA-transferase CaiB-like acyl-CoA transferase
VLPPLTLKETATTADGALVLIAIQNEREWANFCAYFLEEANLSSRLGFDSNVARVSNRPTVEARIATAFAQLTRHQVTTRLRAANTAFGFINDIPALARHPALRRISVGTPTGPVQLVAPPVISSSESRHLGPIPAFGEHSKLIRAEFSAKSDAAFSAR